MKSFEALAFYCGGSTRVEAPIVFLCLLEDFEGTNEEGLEYEDSFRVINQYVKLATLDATSSTTTSIKTKTIAQVGSPGPRWEHLKWKTIPRRETNERISVGL